MVRFREVKIGVAALLYLLLANSIVFGGSISGRVTRESNGEPIAGIPVYAWEFDTWDWGGSETTDANGDYEIVNLMTGNYRVSVDTWNTDYVQEYYDEELDWEEADPVGVVQGQPTSGIDFELAIGGSISGVVSDANGIGLEGVSVEVLKGTDPCIADEDAWEWVENVGNPVTTDANGEYRFTRLAARQYHVYVGGQNVSGKGYFEAHLYNVAVFSGVETSDISFVLRRAGRIYGYVRTDGGDPIDNADVIVEAAWSEGGWGWHSTWVDANGFYEFFLAPSPGEFYPVLVRNASRQGNYYECKWDGNFYKATYDGMRVDYELERGGAVTGRVVNEDGVGIGDVHLEGEWSKYGVDFGSYDITDSDGYFEIGGLATGTNYIFVNNDWREIEQDGVKYMVGEAYAGPIELSAGDVCNVGTFTIYEAGMVTGVITDETGFPIKGVEVELEGKDIEGNWADRDEVFTDAFGQFTVDYVAPGTYNLFCAKAGFVATIETAIEVDRGEHVDIDVVVKSAAEGARVSGRIANYEDVIAYDSDGVPFPYFDDYEEFGVPEFEILALRMDRAFTKEDYLDVDRMIIAWADADEIDDEYGDYFEPDFNETAGNYQMTVRAGDVAIGMDVGREYLPGWGGCVILHDWKRFNFAKGDVVNDVNFTAVITNTGTLKGDITVPAGYDYYPEDWCLIYAYALDENGHIKTAIPVGDAVAFPGWTTRYEFRELPAGKYMLKAYARNLASVIVPSVRVDINGTTTQNIVFTSGGVLTGHISDANGGEAVEEAVVTIEETGEQGRTDDLGHYRIEGINAGIYTVAVSASGYADAASGAVNIVSGEEAILDFALDSTVGSICGVVKIDAPSEPNVNGVTVVAYNASDDTFGTSETVGGEFCISDLTPGDYILAVDTAEYGYGVVVYPADGNRVELLAKGEVNDVEIWVETVVPPVFTVYSSVNDANLSMKFYSEPNLLAEPNITVLEGAGSLGVLTSNSKLSRFEIDYAVDASDDIVRIEISESDPILPGAGASKTFTFEVGSNLVQTSSTNITNATGGKAQIMGTQDNTNIYVPPFAIAGANDTEVVALVIERYGDPGDAAPGTSSTTVSAIYDFEFDNNSVSVDVDHTFTVTMSFQLPSGMSQGEFEATLEIKYFDAGAHEWRTDGISNVRINWANSTIMFEVSHLSKFAAFVGPMVDTRFGSFDGVENVKRRLKDCDGTVVFFELEGGGYGEVTGGCEFSEIILRGTTEESKFRIRTKGKKSGTSVGDIRSDGPLKSIIAKTTDLRGDIVINGSLGGLVLDDVAGEHSISIVSPNGPTAAAVVMKFDVVSDCSIDCNTLIKSITATKWLDTDGVADEIRGPALGQLRITGTKKRRRAGHFQANLTLTGVGVGPNQEVLGSAKISGVLTGAVDINGDVGSMEIGRLRGDVTINGSAKRIRINNPMAGYPRAGHEGSLYVSGTAKVVSGRKKTKTSITFSDGALYSSGAKMYGFEELRRYDVLGASWDYASTYTMKIRGPGIREKDVGSDTVTLSVRDNLEEIDGRLCYVIDFDSDSTGTSGSMAWYTGKKGIYQVVWISGSDFGELNMKLYSAWIAPVVLRLGKRYSDRGRFKGRWTLDPPSGPGMRGNVKGSARTSCELVGHSQVTVPAGTYIAAKVKEKLVFQNSTMRLKYRGRVFRVNFTASGTETWYGVPDVGIVKSVANVTIKLSVPGEGSASAKLKSTEKLTSYSN